AQAHTRQTFRAAVIFGERLERDAPPKIPVKLNVPLVPTGVGGIAPAFFLKQLADLAEKMMSIFPLVAPIRRPGGTATKFGLQFFVRHNDAARRAFEMQPGEVTGKSPNERLHEGEQRHEQTGVDGIVARLDPLPHHVGKRNAQRAAEHQIRNNAQPGHENTEPEKKNRQGEPFDAAQIGGDLRLRPRINRLEKSFAENSVINHGPSQKPTEARLAVNLAAPFRGAGRPEKNEMFETQKRFGLAVAFLLPNERAQSETPVMKHHRARTERDDATGLLQTPAKIAIVARGVILGVKTAD